jgi:hypothetical protein
MQERSEMNIDELPASCVELLVAHLDYDTLMTVKEVSRTLNGACARMEDKVSLLWSACLKFAH